MTFYSTLTELPEPHDIDSYFRTDVLIANSRLEQARICAAVETVFAAHPTLGAIRRGSWGWAVEPPGVTVAEVIARQRASFDMRLGRLFAVSLLPGAPQRLVLAASYLCADKTLWRAVIDDVITAYDGGVLTRTDWAG